MGALNPNLFTMIVAMAVITTMAMPPTLRWALARLPMSKEEKQRLDREEMEAKGFVPNLERLLLAVDDSANGKFATRIGGMIAGSRGMPTTVMQIKTDRKTGKAAAEAQKEKAKESRRNRAGGGASRAAGGRDQKVRRPAGAQEARRHHQDGKRPQAGSHRHRSREGLRPAGHRPRQDHRRKSEFHDGVTEVAAGFEGPLAVADARGPHLEEPIEGRLNILVPINGTATSRHAAEVAIVLARASKAPLTALYVTAGGKKTRSRHYEEAILKDIVALAESYGLDCAPRCAPTTSRTTPS